MDYHRKKVAYNKKRFRTLQVIIILASSIVQLVNVIDFLPVSTRIISASLGSLITIATSLMNPRKPTK